MFNEVTHILDTQLRAGERVVKAIAARQLLAAQKQLVERHAQGVGIAGHRHRHGENTVATAEGVWPAAAELHQHHPRRALRHRPIGGRRRSEQQGEDNAGW